MLLTHKVKKNHLPREYYASNLTGCLGISTKNGWHKWNGLCPFHEDRSAGSFVINVSTGAFYCFACGAKGGDIISFHQKRYKLSFQEALHILAKGGAYA